MLGPAVRFDLGAGSYYERATLKHSLAENDSD